MGRTQDRTQVKILTIFIKFQGDTTSAIDDTEEKCTDSEDDHTGGDSPKHQLRKMQSTLDRANKLIRKQTLLIKRLREQNRRDSKKINLQNKILNDLMEIFNLNNEDIVVLRTEILKSDMFDSP